MEKEGKRTRQLLIGITIILMLLSAMMLFSFKTNVPKKNVSSEIEKYQIDAYLQEDGSAKVVEKINYNLDGANGVIRKYEFPRTGQQQLKLESVKINEKEENMKKVLFAKKGDSGVYTFNEDGVEQELKIFQPTNGKLIVEINYQIESFITEYQDMQSFEWRFYDSKDAIAPLNMSVEVYLPTEVSTEEMKIFGHGDLEGNIEIYSGKSVGAKIPVFKKDTFGIMVLLLPTKPLQNVQYKIAENKYQSALEYENTEAEKTNQLILENIRKEEENRKLTEIIQYAWVVLVIVTFCFVWIDFKKIYQRYDKEQYVSEIEYYREIPGKYGPAVSALVADANAEVGQKQLAAALFSLYIKGYLIISMVTGKKKKDKEILITILEKSKKDLPENEKHLYDWVGVKCLDDKILYADFLCANASGESIEEQKDFIEKYEEFKRKTKHEYEDLRLKKFVGRTEKMFFLTDVSVYIFFLSSAFAFFYVGNITLMVYGILIFFAIMIQRVGLSSYKRNCYRYTEKGEKEHSKCKGLKKYLEDYSLINEAPLESVAIWKNYFVYGLSLGVSDRALNDLYEKLPFDKRGETESVNMQYGEIILMNHLLRGYHFNSYSRNQIETTQQNVISYNQEISRTSDFAGNGSGGGFSGGGSFGGGGFGGGGSSSF